MASALNGEGEWILLSEAVARMAEISPVYRSYPGRARDELERAIKARRVPLRGRPPGFRDEAPRLISMPITPAHELKWDRNSLVERERRRGHGATLIFEDVELNWPPTAEYLRSLTPEATPQGVSRSRDALSDWMRANKVIGYGSTKDLGQKPNSERADHQTSEPAAIPLRGASDKEIICAITAVYNELEKAGRKPPNVKELLKPVQEKLRASNLEATQGRIGAHSEAPQFKDRRWKRGRKRASKAVRRPNPA